MKSYKEILDEYGDNYIPYNILLSTKEWWEKRNAIANREKYLCQNCGGETANLYMLKLKGKYVQEVPAKVEIKVVEIDVKDPFTKEVLGKHKEERPVISENLNPLLSHVHHTFYVKNHLPWEYNDNHLMHLCNKCHYEVHQNSIIYIYSSYENRQDGQIVIPCGKCNGTGFLKEYNYHQNGICFGCQGKGY